MRTSLGQNSESNGITSRKDSGWSWPAREYITGRSSCRSHFVFSEYPPVVLRRDAFLSQSTRPASCALGRTHHLAWTTNVKNVSVLVFDQVAGSSISARFIFHEEAWGTGSRNIFVDDDSAPRMFVDGSGEPTVIGVVRDEQQAIYRIQTTTARSTSVHFQADCGMTRLSGHSHVRTPQAPLRSLSMRRTGLKCQE